MGNIQFQDFSILCKDAIQDAGIAFLDEIGGEFVSQTQRNSRVDSGQTKGSWDYVIDEGELSTSIGSPLENAIWEEFGTGEYALQGNGRKGGWRYQDDKGKWHFTMGKKPNRALWKALETLKPSIQKLLEEKLRGI